MNIIYIIVFALIIRLRVITSIEGGCYISFLVYLQHPSTGLHMAEHTQTPAQEHTHAHNPHTLTKYDFTAEFRI